MTYRIETKRRAGEPVLVFFGLLDESAVTDLAAHLARAASTELVLARGAEVTPGAMARLRNLPVAVHAESPFLAAWLRGSDK